jgi:hypothetical protein
MMYVKVQYGGRIYDLGMPEGSRVERRPGREPLVVIPGPRPDDTSTMLTPAALLRAAHEGRYGVALCDHMTACSA